MKSSSPPSSSSQFPTSVAKSNKVKSTPRSAIPPKKGVPPKKESSSSPKKGSSSSPKKGSSSSPQKRSIFGSRSKERSGPNREQIREFLNQWMGVLPADEARMLRGVFSLSETTVREIMVPLSELMAVHLKTPTEQLKALVKNSNYRHIPVYEDRIDRLTGVINIMHVLYAQEASDLTQFVMSAYYVPETKLAGDLLGELSSSEDPVAIVIDEHGGCVGFVRFEDVIELITGNIACNRRKHSFQIEMISADSWSVDARASIASVNDQLGIGIQKDRYDTIGGFILKLIGRLPEQGEKITFNGFEFVVEETFGYGISLIRANKLKAELSIGKPPNVRRG